MAHHPCSRVPSVARPVDPEKVDVSVEIRLQVPRRHPREAPKVALEPGARVVHHLHPLRVDRVVDVRPVHLAVETSLPDQHAEGMLEIMDEQRPESRPVTAAAGRMHGQYLRCGGIGPHGGPPARASCGTSTSRRRGARAALIWGSAGSLAAMALTLERRPRQSARPGKPYGEGRAPGSRGTALLLKLLSFSTYGARLSAITRTSF